MGLWETQHVLPCRERVWGLTPLCWSGFEARLLSWSKMPASLNEMTMLSTAVMEMGAPGRLPCASGGLR